MSAMIRCPHCQTELTEYRNFSVCLTCGWSQTKPLKIRRLRVADYQKILGENN